MRGTGTDLSWVCLHTRFIPADAGNGPVATSDYARSPVYPRGCGERPSFRFGPYSLNGLSPPMRGTEADDIAMFLKARFIPADAGNSETLRLGRGLSAVYPRGCGERFAWAVVCSICAGLSPRMRGTVLPAQCGPANGRFIPADAGNGDFALGAGLL